VDQEAGVAERAGGASDAAPGVATSWPRAFIAAAVMIVASFVLLVLVPNTLLGFLTTRVVPTWRDILVVAYWMVAFVVCCLLFVRLQRGRN
jgi:hypothetical protein